MSVSGVMPMEKTEPSDDSRIASPRRFTDTATVGCSGGYSVQLRTATSSARANCSKPRKSSGDSWDVWATERLCPDPIYSPHSMRAVDVIMKKRDGRSLSRDEIRFFVEGVTSG